MDFQTWFEATIAHEGGFVFDPDDKGGATNFGITQSSYSEFKNRKVTVDEIQNMGLEQAKEFYQNLFATLGLNAIPSSCQRGYSDAVVNLGKGGASKVIQMATNTKLRPTNSDDWIDVDGIIGSGSRQAIQEAKLNFWDFYAELGIWYANLILKGCGFGNPRTEQNKFARGWYKRLLENFFQDRLDEMSSQELEQILVRKKNAESEA